MSDLKRDFITAAVRGMALVAILAPFAATDFLIYQNTKTVEKITIGQTAIKRNSESSDIYLINGLKQDGTTEVFSNQDNFWAAKFISSDFQLNLKEGDTYCASVHGWRIPALSWYRNIDKLGKPNAHGDCAPL